MLICTDKSLYLSLGGNHIHLLFADLIGILLLPALVLRRPELGGGEALLLTVFHAEVFLLGLVLPLALRVQRTYCQQNVGMGIVTVGVVDGGVGTHPVRHKLCLDIFLQQCDLFLTVQLYGQSDDKFTRQPTVFGCLYFFHGVP